MSNKDKAIEMLREFSTFQGMGFRGIVRMKRMQADAVALLAKIDKQRAKSQAKTVNPPEPNRLSWLAIGLREWNGHAVDEAGFRDLCIELYLRNFVMPPKSWGDFYQWAIEWKWLEVTGSDQFIIRARSMNEMTFRQQFLGEWKPYSGELITLAELACHEYDRRCDLSEDPEHPWRIRRGAPSFSSISQEEVSARYGEAIRLGFEGDIYAWRDFVFHQRPRESR